MVQLLKGSDFEPCLSELYPYCMHSCINVAGESTRSRALNVSDHLFTRILLTMLHGHQIILLLRAHARWVLLQLRLLKCSKHLFTATSVHEQSTCNNHNTYYTGLAYYINSIHSVPLHT